MKDAKRLIIGILVGITLSLPLAAADFVQGEVIVKFKQSPVMYKAVADAGETRAIAVAVDDTEKALEELKARSDVEYVEPNYIIEAEDTPEDWPYAASQWLDLELSQAWDLMDQTGPGEEIVVAVVDSGVDMDHPDLEGILTSGYDFANNDAVPEDDAGHGTRVCGIIGALGENDIGIAGVAWNTNITIMPLKFMKQNDGKTTGTLTDAINAIYFAVDNGADIINASWGFSSYSSSLQDAIAYARDRGVLFIASAGNSGQDNDTKDHYPSNYSLENIIAVAAMNSSGALASFSNYGKTTVDIAAPGVGISTTDINDGYVAYASGTSFATPFVAAITAMVKSQAPDMSYADLRSIVINSAVKGKGGSLDTLSSGGCVNAYQALLAEQNFDASSGDASSAQQSQSQGSVQAAAAGGGGGGGGGCMIDTCKDQGSSALVIFITMTLLVLFRMPCVRRLG